MKVARDRCGGDREDDHRGPVAADPTAALAEVGAGERYIVTRHRRPVAKLTPPDAQGPVRIVPAKTSEPSNLSALPPRDLKTAVSVDQLIADMQSAW